MRDLSGSGNITDKTISSGMLRINKNNIEKRGRKKTNFIIKN